MGTEASRLTLDGAPACEPGGVGESDHSDSSCLVSSSTLAAAVSSSICFRSMCFMARAGQEGVAVRTRASGQRPASTLEGLSGASPAPYPSSHWKFRSRRSLVLWNASLSMVPAEAGRLRRCVGGWVGSLLRPRPQGTRGRRAARQSLDSPSSFHWKHYAPALPWLENANSFKSSWMALDNSLYVAPCPSF